MFKRITPIALGLAMLAVASVQSYAFMVATDEVPTQEAIDLVEMIEGLELELEDEELQCEDMLAKLDAALEEIDTALDVGVEDEASHLVARDALISMRLELPCLGEELAQGCVPCQQGVAVAQPVRNVAPAPIFNGGGGGIIGGGGFGGGGFGGGLGGGGAFAGGGGGGLLLLGGAAAAIAIPLAGSDDDDPGDAATTMAP